MVEYVMEAVGTLLFGHPATAVMSKLDVLQALQAVRESIRASLLEFVA